MKKSYVFNDESKKNSYGFKIKTDGIDLSARFNTNPICLNNHQNDTKNVLGKWIDVEQLQGLLVGKPEFDTEDLDGKEVVRKVNKGTIVSVSMGIFFEPEDMVYIDGELWLLKCELFEVSFVAVPSNANSVTLYNKKDGKQYTDSQVKQLTLSINNQHINIQNMKLITTHLQLADGAGEIEVLNAIKALELKYSTENTQLKTEKAELKAKYDAVIEKQTAELKASYETERDLAVKDGRIDEAGKAPIDEMVLKSGYEAGLKLLTSLPKRTPIAGKLETPAAQLAALEKMSWDELDKGNHLGKLKADNPDYYAQRFEQQFGKKPNQ
ncbi:HK97 family phage prohead protease [Empedobacter sp. GD03797]|uniref:HK97 family phage prohead protease n=1 Tax=Empedobacter sp. GD03797 TaxID=2975382 RepID=UPI002447034B|nr:HK97 family phage prohead protease [Empedobacter sp. GD03797]MDH1881178.1 HK97 family phage prohead protease [Empedobacter sp. GD03797]